MKEIWAVEFDRVCCKHCITYIASGGTMLGTVRHHGFIPWDDDIDLMMMRDQYEKLCNVAEDEFKHPYFFQSEKTEPGFRRRFAKLRNTETTAIQEREITLHPKYNQGIFIDIFPLDGVPDNEKEYYQQYNLFCFYRKLYYRFLSMENLIYYDNDPLAKKMIKKAAHLFLGAPARALHLTDWAYKKAEAVCKSHSDQETEFISLLSFQFENLGHALRRSDMDNIIEMDFEFLKMPVTANYDEHLRRKYGDYMTPAKDPSYHGDLIFDTNIGYVAYYQQHQELLRK